MVRTVYAGESAPEPIVGRASARFVQWRWRMPRPERELYPDLDPLHHFAAQLRQLRTRSGNPTYKNMARRSGKSSSTLADAAGGDQLPSWDTVVAYAKACGADPERLLPIWERIRDLRESGALLARVTGPGDLSNLPHRPSVLFLGSAALNELDELLRHDRPGVIGAAVYGLGGVGKTELALQYANLHHTRYTPLWWVPADTADNVAAGLAALTRTLVPAWPATASTADAAAWALRWLTSHDGWLLVLDNVDDVAVIGGVLAAARQGRVIVTSRRDLDWQELGLAPVRLDVLPRQVSVELLVRRSGREREHVNAEALAADVADLPLALNHAAAYLLARPHVGLAEYRRRLAAQPANILGATTLSRPTDDSVARTWQVTIAAVADENRLAASLLTAMAYFAPDAIPVSLLIGPADAGRDPTEVDDALSLSASYSLITRTGSVVGIHRLVQTVIRALQSGPDGCAEAIGLLTAALPGGDPEVTVGDWPRWAQLAPHIETLAYRLRTERSLVADGELALRAWSLLSRCGIYLRGQGQYVTALTLFEQFAAFSDKVLGTEDTTTVTARYLVAGGLWSAGRFAEALVMGEGTLVDRRRLLGPDHPDTLSNASYVGLGYRELGRLDEAVELTMETLWTRTRVLGSDHPETLQSRNNLAGCYRALGRHGTALDLYRSTAADRERVLGSRHPDTLQSRHNLAGGLQASGSLTEAIDLYESTLVIRTEVLGSKHPDTLHTQHKLACAYAAADRIDDAVALHEATQRMRIQLLGTDHPDTRASVAALDEVRGETHRHPAGPGRTTGGEAPCR
ncbi:FxSxx-COOH system tetratricopeptide repeat protein [Micromonospora tarensis]|uniref:Tetratricopeptide repeat protein n=1 Tax=Micromonospora tarensis TaxID=2806100 RepID=A0ABS1YIA9_9ACTN|nr:FxSxx-COOH system tetratricopeptide repeat protein [Micromonospora tarensis]MBM0277165.1 tetratricopeptide repeat protein [Micromonospora tarensis]